MNELEHKTYKNNINQAANEYYSLSQKGANLTNSRVKLISSVYFYLLKRHKYCRAFSVESDLEILQFETVINLLDQKIQKWAPGRADFFTYFIHFFDLRIITELKENKETTLISIDQEIYDDHSDTQHEVIPDVRAIEKENARIDVTALFDILYNAIKKNIKQYENSPKFCYSVRFFTEFTTEMVSELDINSRDVIPEKTLELIDRAFAEFYLQKNNEKPVINDFSDIISSDLRPLSDFTCKEADRNVKCGYQLKNIVYQKYIEKVRGKKVSASNISEQRIKFVEVLSQVRKEHSDV